MILRSAIQKLKSRWAYTLVAAPFLTDWLDRRHLPRSFTECTNEIVVGILLLVSIRLLYRESDALRAMATTDALTGCFNRRQFREDLEREIGRTRRLKVPLTLAYIDVDRFKHINDTFGHLVGDAVLREVAQALMASIRRHMDRCYRLGGDEFVVLFAGVGAPAALEILHRFRHETSDLREVSRCRVTFSFGASELHDGDSIDEFLRRAESHMYAEKRRSAQEQRDGS